MTYPAPDPAVALIEEAEKLLQMLETWRSWAQFVYLGGGPIPLGTSDDALRAAVCEHQSASLAALETEIAELRKENSRLKEASREWAELRDRNQP